MTARLGSMPVVRYPTRASSSTTFSVNNSSSPALKRRFWTAGRRFLPISFASRLYPGASNSRHLAQVRPESLSELWFTASFPAKVTGSGSDDGKLKSTFTSRTPGNANDHKPPDEKTVRLGKTLRTLSPLLPHLLTKPIPQQILSPNISLHLFPSTHPHLPIVKGRVPFRAALWTAPVAWGSVPIVGNNELEIISEKIVRTGLVSAPVVDDELSNDLIEEKLVVRWRAGKRISSATDSTTSASSLSSSTENGGINRGLSTLLGGSQPIFNSTSSEPFTGLFIFSFDKQGRIASQTIEHADESHGCDKTSRVVTLTDWLLGKAKWGRLEREAELGPVPGLAMRECREWVHHNDRRWAWRTQRRS